MLTGTPTKYGAGITLSGDFFDLMALRETITDLVYDNLNVYHEEFVLALAYDIRHAYQGNREKDQLKTPYGKVTYFSVNIPWPVFLVQVALIRSAAAYRTTTQAQQAHLYLLGSCGTTALQSLDGTVAGKCSDWLNKPIMLPENYLIDFVDYQARTYVSCASTLKKRIQKLPEIMAQINEHSSQYKSYADELERIAKQDECKPQDLHDFTEWPEFKW
jgi:hypothetical protein